MKQAITRVTSTPRPAEFWQSLVQKWERSGQSQQAIADAAGVSVHTFQYWRSKLQSGGAGATIGRRGPTEFVEVALSPTKTTGAMPCRIRVGEQVVVELPELPPVGWLRELGGVR